MKTKNVKSAAVVVLYNPNQEVRYNIEEYRKEFYRVYCVDNSLKQNKRIADFENTLYIPLYKNTGVAYALNVGCKKAISDGCDTITLFDQDTFCPALTAKELINQMNKEMINGKLAVVAPNIKYIYRDANGKRILSEDEIYNENSSMPAWVITAGSTFRAETYKRLKGFDDKLFIGQIDCEFCYRLKHSLGDIRLLHKFYIYQELGNTKIKKIFKKKLHIPNMMAMRYYYLFRNEIYLRKKWGKSYEPFKIRLYKYFGCIIFFEKEKKKKLRACMKGAIDALSL